MFTDEQIKQIKEILDPIHHRLDAQRDQINRVHDELSKQITNEMKDIADIMSREVFNKLDDHKSRIIDLESIDTASSKQ